MSDAMDKSSELSTSSQMIPTQHLCQNHTRIVAEVHTMTAQQAHHVTQIKELFDRVREIDQLLPIVNQLAEQVKAQNERITAYQAASQALAQQVDRAEAAALGFRNGVCEAQKDIDGLGDKVSEYTQKAALQEQRVSNLDEKLSERTTLAWRVLYVVSIGIVLSGIIWVAGYTLDRVSNQAATKEMLRVTIQEAFKEFHSVYSPPKGSDSK